MEFVNTTSYPTIYYDSLDQFGALFHVVILRQRFLLTPDGLMPAKSQPPVCVCDEQFEGDFMRSVRQESDLCTYKPNCDVIVNAVAYAREGIPARRVRVRMVVETSGPLPRSVMTRADVPLRSEEMPAQHRHLIDKTLVVTGDRDIIRRSLMSRFFSSMVGVATLGIVRIPHWKVTNPKAFVSFHVRYEGAYGGENRMEAQPGDRDKQVRSIGAKICLSSEQVAQHPDAAAFGRAVPLAHSVCEQNPAGTGYAATWYIKHCRVKSIPAPRIEYADEPFNARAFSRSRKDERHVRPAGLGVVGRTWQPRRSLLGSATKEVQWTDDEFPTLPGDFNHRYWNSAPLDQQCVHLRGDEFITLINLAPAGAPLSSMSAAADTVQCFQLPGHAAYLALGDADGRVGAKPCALDTVYIDPETATVDLVWRGTVSASARITDIHLLVAESGDDRAKLEMLQLQAQSATDDLLPLEG